MSAPPHEGVAPRLAVPFWPLVGAFLAVSFPQVWWAREPMAESALGAFIWMVAWAGVRWLAGRGWRWGLLAGLATVCALFTRADGILLLGAFALVALAFAVPGRWTMLLIVALGGVAAGLHYAILAPTYMSTTYGPFTASRAAFGLAALVIVVGVIGVARWRGWLNRWFFAGPTRLAVPPGGPGSHVPRSDMSLTGESAPSHNAWALRAWRAGVLLLIALATLSALSGVAPGVGRDSTGGAPSPLAWLPGYVPWPLIILAALGLTSIAWSGAPRQLVPLLLVGGLPALLYLPDPLVTGDHPWMSRRLVPAVIPLIAILASVGAVTLWRLELSRALSRVRFAGPLAAAFLIGLGFGFGVAQDRDLIGPRHGAGAIDGLATLAGDLPTNAVVIFPAGPAGLHLAMPIQTIFGLDTFAIPEVQLTPAVAAALKRMEALGREVYWAEDAGRPLNVPSGISAVRLRTARIRYALADYGRRPPPLELTGIEHLVTLYRITTQ